MNENSRLVQVKKGTYDATPTLVNEFTVDYSYDEMGRMLRRDDGTDVTDYFWDKWSLWREVTGESVTEYLVPGLGICSFLRAGELYTLHGDGLGSVRTVTDSEGSVRAQMEFGVYGTLLEGSFDGVPGGVPSTWIGALGVRFDALTGLCCMRERWYDPFVQRFVSRDPISLEGGANLYAYVSNPSILNDPSGLGCRELVETVQVAARNVGPLLQGGMQVSGSLYLAFALELGVAPAIGAAVGVSSVALTGYFALQLLMSPSPTSNFDPVFNVTAAPALQPQGGLPADMEAELYGSALRADIQRNASRWVKRSIQDVAALFKKRGPRGRFELYERYCNENEALNSALHQGLISRSGKDVKWIGEFGKQDKRALGKPRTHRLWIFTQQGTRTWLNESSGVEHKSNEPWAYGIKPGALPEFNSKVVVIVPQRL